MPANVPGAMQPVDGEKREDGKEGGRNFADASDKRYVLRTLGAIHGNIPIVKHRQSKKATRFK